MKRSIFFIVFFLLVAGKTEFSYGQNYLFDDFNGKIIRSFCFQGQQEKDDNQENHDVCSPIISSSGIETNPDGIVGGVLITAPAPINGDFPYPGLRYSQGIYRYEHHPSNTAVIQSTRPMDPNEIIGMEGYDAEGSEDTMRWVSATQRLAYTVYFENDSALATAAAQKITIHVPVDEKMDYATFGVGSFGFGSFVYTVEGSPTSYQTRIDLRDSLGIYVDVVAGLDIVRHEAFWILQSIDPATGLPPTDINRGFLAINDSLHSGEGFVTFTIKPKAYECATGDTVPATASIVFDINEPISTNTWVNTVDAFAPTSSMSSELNSDGDMLTATFTGVDDEGGCGLKQYRLYYSLNGNAYQLYDIYPAGEPAHIPLDNGNYYRFFVLAEDHVGNCEPMKSQPEFTIGTNVITLTANSFPTDAGLTTGTGTYSMNDTVTLTATAAEGYHFVHWIHQGAVESTQNPYSLAVNQNQTYTAYFERNAYTLQILAAEGSTITVTDLNGNEIPSGSTIYHFDHLIVSTDTLSCYQMTSCLLNGSTYVPGDTLTIDGDVQIATQTVSTNNHTDFAVEVCENHTWNGQTYTQSGDYTQHFQTVNGCDSTVTLHLTVHNDVTHQFSETACGSYTWNGQTYTQNGDYTQHFQTIHGCDSTVTLHLIIQNAVTHQFTETTCDSYTWNGQTYYQSGDYTQNFQTFNGCDSTVTLHLTIHYSAETEFPAWACDSYTWNGQTYYQSGDYVQNFQTVHGCDSAVTLHLTIHNAATSQFTETACDSYTWNSQTYAQSGDYVQHFQTVNGCDSAVTLHLTIHNAVTSQFTETACDNYTWNGQTYYQSGDYTQNFQTFHGCDSTVTLHLIIYNSVTSQFTETACDSYTWNGQTYTQSGDYTQHFQTVHGCDSAVTLHLTISGCIPAGDALPCPGHETVTDYDGNVYNTVKIGDQCWMKENLRVTHYEDGVEIPAGPAGSFDVAYRYCPNNDSSTVPTYGYLYNWAAVMHGSQSSDANPSVVQGICPAGWHVPSNSEWGQLRNYVSSQPQYRSECHADFTYSYFGRALASTVGWTASEDSCSVGFAPYLNNATGFDARPAGYFFDDSQYNDGINIIGSTYYETGLYALFWSSTISEPTISAMLHAIIINQGSAYPISMMLTSGLSVRCVLGDVPVVTTHDESDITNVSATGGGTVTYNDNTVVTARGVCWSISHNPTIVDAHTVDGSGTGSFNSTITGLQQGTLYYVRAYATSNSGTIYGEETSFSTRTVMEGDAQPCPSVPTVTDYDGNIYTTVKIGEQCWMKENLRTTHYEDGVEILAGSVPSFDIPYRYYPNGDSSNVPTYGYLYNWAAVMHGMAPSDANPSGVQGICPSGWHIPSDVEWTQLTSYVSSVPDYVCGDDSTFIARALAAEEGWQMYSNYLNSCRVGSFNPYANNITGFSARPAGCYGYFSDTSYVAFGKHAVYWSASEYSPTEAWDRSIWHGRTYMNRFYPDKDAVISVRCILGDGVNLARVSTDAVGDVTRYTATCVGNVTYDGNAAVTTRGVCWSTSQSPTVADAHTTDGTGTGTFTSSITGLTPNTTYYVRAYATNSAGTVYGEQKLFRTLCDVDTIFFEDFDGDMVQTTTSFIFGPLGDWRVVGDTTYNDEWNSIPLSLSGQNSAHAPVYSSAGNASLTTHNIYLNSSAVAFNHIYLDFDHICKVSDLDQARICYQVAYGLTSDGTPQWDSWRLFQFGNDNYHDIYLGDAAHETVMTVTNGNFSENCYPEWGQDMASQISSPYWWHHEKFDVYPILSTQTNQMPILIRFQFRGNKTSPHSSGTDTCAGWYVDNITVTLTSCDISNDSSLHVLTAPATNITATTAVSGGRISSYIQLSNSRGVCWSTSPYPTLADAHTTDSIGWGTFTSNITGLSPTTTYYLRAYAINNGDTIYGDVVNFTTRPLCDPCSSQFSDTICENELPYTWNGQTYHQSGDYTQTFFKTDGCDSIVTLHLNINSLITKYIETTACGSYSWNGTDFTQSGEYTRTFSAANGCDSIVTLHLTICDIIENLGVSDISSHSAVVSWEVDSLNTTYYLGAVPEGRHFISNESPKLIPDGVECNGNCMVTMNIPVSGFDSSAIISSKEDIAYVRLKMEHSYIGDLWIAIACPNGQRTSLIKRYNSGTSTCTQLIPSSEWGWTFGSGSSPAAFLGTPNENDDASDRCDPTINPMGIPWNYCWSNQTFNEYQYTYGNVYSSLNTHFSSVDSTNAILMTNVFNPDGSFSNLVGCPLNGNWQINIMDGYGSDNGYLAEAELVLSPSKIDTITADSPTVTVLLDDLNSNTDYTLWLKSECETCNDSIQPVHFTTSISCRHDSLNVDITACDSYTWNGQTYSQSGDYTQHFQTIHGCDSAVTLHLTIHNAVTRQFSETACDSYTWNGQTYYQSGDYTQHFQTVHGCDSTVTLHLTIHNAATHQFSITACDSYTWNGQTYSQSGDYTQHFQTVHGCDSIVVLHLTIYQSKETAWYETACDSYTWNDQTYTQSGTYVQHFQTVNGCDSTVTLHLTINNFTATEFAATTCDSYSWNGQTYYQSGDFVQYFQTVNGCDSTVTLHLTIHNAITYQFSETACDSYTWNGQTYYQSGDYVQNFQTVNGCDSTVTVHLTISDFAATEFTVSACDSYSWNGQTYHQSGDYMQHFQTVHGCDSAVTLHLTIHNAATRQISETACDSYIWNGQTYTQSGNYVQHFQTVHGCDST
ncbi:MAG: fibrobacter succinogenes major paralogous domain-containing protein, partial [Bacteroidales bacterium]|nr:fibrobacter succinogenes major paralogous domain-containing protein [Bacteroidales bacterium]